MFPNYSNVFSNHYYETVVPFAHDQQQQPFPIQSPSFDLASIVSSSSKQDQDLLENTAHHDHLHTPFSHIYFPSPLEDGEVILQQQQQQQQQQQVLHQQQQKPVITTTKRSCKKDRHSKIRTARGLRDRRMRLSLDVAKKFFGLQDMLGFDKASKTVQWLLTQAGDNIRKLASDVCGQIETQSSFSECEMVSGTEDAATGDVVDDDKPIRGKPSSSSCAKNGIKKTNVRQPKNAMLNNLAKASRKNARERARERTREKMERQQAKPCNDANQEAKKLDDLSRLMSSWSQSHNDFNTSSFEVVLGGDEVVEVPPSIFQAPRRDDLMNEIDGQDARYAANFVTTGKWSPCDTILSYLQNTSASISQEIADSAMYGKPWEVIDLQQ